MLLLPTKMALAKERSSVFFITLYCFHLINETLYFAACDEDIPWYVPQTTTPVIYKAMPIQIETVKSSVDCKVDNVSLSVSNIDDVFTGALFQGYEFRGRTVEVFQISYPESLGEPSEFRPMFCGKIDDPELDEKEKTFKVTLKSNFPNTQPGRTFMLSCNAIEFGDEETCGANKVTLTGAVQTGSDQNNVYIQQTMANDYWQHGMITIAFETRKIISNTGNYVEVEYPFSFTPTGTYSIETGCSKSKQNCIKWGNLHNYSGFLNIPFQYTVIS